MRPSPLGNFVPVSFEKAGVADQTRAGDVGIAEVMTTLFALFSEVERDLISEPTREGLAKARSSGKKLGRPKGSLGVSRFDGKEDEIRHFLRLGIASPTLYHFIDSRGPPSPM